jgi:glycosyltransferase involved in cell wall biosynthesis
MAVPARISTTQAPKHICIFPDRLDNGGIGRYTINLAEALLAQGAKVDLFVTAPDGGLFSQKPKEARLFVGGGSTKKSVVPFFKYLRKERPDLLITANPYIDIVGVIINRLAGQPSQQAVTIHTARSADDMSGKKRVKQMYEVLCRLLYPRAHHIVAVSNAVARDTKAYFSLQKPIRVIYNPVVNPSLYKKSEAIPHHSFYKDKQVPILLAIGRMTTQKDFPTLLKAFAEVRQKLSAKLLILGEGEHRKMLESLAKDLHLGDDLSMPGFVDNPYPYIKQADALISSSTWEGLPTVLIEALALGTAVVATDCPGGSSEILEGGKYGRLVQMKNPSALATAMLAALGEVPDKSRLMERGQAFSLEASALGYLRLLEV